MDCNNMLFIPLHIHSYPENVVGDALEYGNEKLGDLVLDLVPVQHPNHLFVEAGRPQNWLTLLNHILQKEKEKNVVRRMVKP